MEPPQAVFDRGHPRSAMTITLYENPISGTPDEHDYTSSSWEATVGADPVAVMEWASTAASAAPNWWDAGDMLKVSWIKFASDGETTSITLTPLFAEGIAVLQSPDAGGVHIYPPRDYTIESGSIVIDNVAQGDCLIVVCGDKTTDGTLHPVAIQVGTPRPAPTGTVVVYDGSQTVAVTDQTLHFTGPGIYQVGDITMQEDSHVEIDGDVIVVGTFQGEAHFTIGGHGTVSGAYATAAEVLELINSGGYEAGLPYLPIYNAAVDPTAANVEIEGINVINSPFASVQNCQSHDGLMVLCPWKGNTVGIHPVNATVNGCLIWSADDTITMQEANGSQVVTNNLLATSYSATFHLAYWPAAEVNSAVTLVVDNDVMAVNHYNEGIGGRRGGYIIVAWSDGEVGEETHVVKGYEFEGLRVWADPSGEIRARPIEFANYPYPWGAGVEPADQIGNIFDIEIRDVSFEVVPTHLSRILGRDADNTPHDIAFRNVTYAGTLLTAANWSTYFQVNQYPYDISWEEVTGGVDPPDPPGGTTGTIVVEDGTGLWNANSYLTVAEAEARLVLRGSPSWWTSRTTAQKESLLREAAVHGIDLMFGASWSGYRNTDTQALDWPRTDAGDSRSGRAILTDVVPELVKLMQIEWMAALAAGTDPLAVADASAIGAVATTDRLPGGFEESRTYEGSRQALPSLPRLWILAGPLLLDNDTVGLS